MSQTKTWQQCIEDVIDIGSVYYCQISQGKVVTRIRRCGIFNEYIHNFIKKYYCEYFLNRSNLVIITNQVNCFLSHTV